MTTLGIIIMIFSILWALGIGITQLFIHKLFTTATKDMPDPEQFTYHVTLKGYILLLLWPYYWWQFRRIARETRESDNRSIEE